MMFDTGNTITNSDDESVIFKQKERVQSYGKELLPLRYIFF